MKEVLLKIQGWFLALTGPLGGWGLLLIALVDSSFLSLPEVNDVLIITLSIRSPDQMIFYCSMTTIGSVLGCMMLYLVGAQGRRGPGTQKTRAPPVGKNWRLVSPVRHSGRDCSVDPASPHTLQDLCAERQRLQGQPGQVSSGHHPGSSISLFSARIPGRPIRPAGSLLHETPLSHHCLGNPGLVDFRGPHSAAGSPVSTDSNQLTQFCLIW